jgi:SAM-dependent methyltransferase
LAGIDVLYETRELRERGAAHVIGVDLSPGMIQLATQREVLQLVPPV